jgi:ribonuclease J
MDFKIHRGTKEIGGTCVEVWTDKTRIILDLGMPLVKSDMTPFDDRETEKRSTEELLKAGILPDIPSLYQDNSNTAVLISHPHKDHYGLMDRINPSCPVWMGKVTHKLIELTNTVGDKPPIENVRYFEHDIEFVIGNITVHPFLMDHSAVDAYAFLIKADGKSLIYSGDFRMHGKKAKMFDWFCFKIEKNVDYLLLEGSTIGRTDKPFHTENELEDDFVQTFKQTKGITLVHVSSQNIDRLTTIYRSCIKTKKIMLVDFYTANVLRLVNKNGYNKIPFPSLKYGKLKVYYPHSLTKRIYDLKKEKELVFPFNNYKIRKDKINGMADKLVMIVRPSVQHDLEQYLQKYTDGCFIYSMWEGYIDQPGKTRDFLNFIATKGMPIKYKEFHTSGHADLSGLKRMVDVVQPKNLVPIHTFEGDKYAELFQGTNIRRVDDRETVYM